MIDPWQAQQQVLAKAPSAEKEWRWFTSSENPAAEPGDYYIALINRHYVASGQADALRVYGHLTEDRSDLIVYRGAVFEELIKPSNKVPDWARSEFHPKPALTGKSRIFKFKTADKSEQDAAK